MLNRYCIWIIISKAQRLAKPYGQYANDAYTIEVQIKRIDTDALACLACPLSKSVDYTKSTLWLGQIRSIKKEKQCIMERGQYALPPTLSPIPPKRKDEETAIKFPFHFVWLEYYIICKLMAWPLSVRVTTCHSGSAKIGHSEGDIFRIPPRLITHILF